MVEPIVFDIKIPAVAKQRARLGRKRRGRKQMAYTPQPTKDFESSVADHIRENLGSHQGFGATPVCVTIDIYKDGFRLAVEPAECSVRPIGIRGDLDNYVKSISDACNMVLWNDDRQVELLTVGFVGIPRGTK